MLEKKCFCSYIDDNTEGLTIHTNNNAESTNNKHKGGRSFKVSYTIHEMIKRDCVTHNTNRNNLIDYLIKNGGNLNTLTSGLMKSAWYQERHDLGQQLIFNFC
jgi:hypothetical protein